MLKGNGKMAYVYARILNRYNIKCQAVFSERFDKQDEADLVLDEFEKYMYLNLNRNLTESDIDSSDVRSHLE